MRILFKHPAVSIQLDENGTILSVSDDAHAHLEGCTILNPSQLLFYPEDKIDIIDLDGTARRLSWTVSEVITVDAEGLEYEL